jgi:hypothetical protein
MERKSVRSGECYWIKAGQKRRRKTDGAAGVLASAIDFLKKQRQGWRVGDASKGWGWKHQGLL